MSKIDDAIVRVDKEITKLVTSIKTYMVQVNDKSISFDSLGAMVDLGKKLVTEQAELIQIKRLYCSQEPNKEQPHEHQ